MIEILLKNEDSPVEQDEVTGRRQENVEDT